MNDQNNKILIVDDDEHILLSLRVLLEPEFGEILCLKDPNQIPLILKDYHVDIILLDMNYTQGETSGKEGIKWLKEILNIDPDINVLLITAYGDLNIAVNALKYGAIDFIVKPWNNEKLVATINAILQYSLNKREVKKLKSKQRALITAFETEVPEIIGTSAVMKDLFKLIDKVAPADANVLIQGENGTGKELFARAIHKRSQRSENPFINVDLGALTETLFESEMFGHKKGAFTDAKEDRIGRFEAGSGGTIFLDEIANLPLAQQSKLLSVIQNREVFPVGSNKAVKIDVRLICGTNVSLKELVANNMFRQDLIYRINTVEINIPALRERIEDIPLLANHFIEKYCKKYRRTIIKLPEYVVRKLQKYHWPGNVRELQHSIERAIILTSDNIFKSSDFDFLEGKEFNQNPFENYNLEDLEKWATTNCLKKHSGNVSRAAKELGLTRGALYRRIEKYGI
ncbi:MAG: sigma-54-dependent Fis family transcriptional regulator [Bacteroidetes bacterium GWF2_33_16]|nr:MAG: sigma-54-dependent Fis family transcriptional regulator [Bacteroidetes bacterium GWE2_32_14]OFY04927.1 MAG: sigma-54-dependent Fis family transcriptional regulator [Bacteroidetes bacterium GWF2_33_16]